MNVLGRAMLWLALPVLLLVGSRVWLASRGVPVLTGDSLFFIPGAMQHLLYGDFSNPFMSPITATGGGPLTWHGWLYPYLLSAIGRAFHVRTTSGLVVVESLILTCTASLFAWLLIRLPVSCWVKLAALTSATSLILATSGRPEVVAQVLLIVWLAIYPRQTFNLSLYATAFVLGCIALAQPTVATLAGMFYCTYLAFRLETRSALWSMFQVGALSISFAAIATLLIYPWELAALVQGILEQGRKLALRTDGDLQYFLRAYLFSLHYPLLIAWPAMLGLAAVAIWRRTDLKPLSALFYPLALMSLLLIWWFGIRNSITVYNVTVFFPLAIYWLAASLPEERLRPFQGLITTAMLTVGALSLAVQLRQSAVLHLSFLHGVPNTIAAQNIRDDLRAGKTVAVTAVMVMSDFGLVKEPRIQIMDDEHSEGSGDADVLYVHQAASGKHHPPTRDGFVLETDRFMNGVQIGGMRVANTPASYNYARYVRIPAQKPEGRQQ